MADAKGAYIGGVPVQFKDAAARAMISDEYNSAETYAKGNLCIYNGKIYEAIKETTGTWDATAWEETTLAKVNGKLNGDIASLTEKSGEYTYSCILGKYYANFAYTFFPFPNNGETITLKSVKTWDNFTEITLTDFSIDKTTKDGFVIQHGSPTYIGNMVDIHFKVSN